MNQRPPDGAVTISALVTDMAGNVLTITTPAVVDNTAPDVKAVLTAPPAVAGSPTLIWTPAHDAVGITRYEVLRGGNVIATVASIAGAQTFSYSDKSAPDQATSTYIVRAWDGAAHSVDSNAVPVLVDSTAVTAAKGLTAPTPTSAAPVLTWSAPSAFAVNHYDVYRDGLLIGSTPGAGATFTDATATEGTHDYAVLARDAASKPGVLSASFKVVFDRTAADERRRADCAGARERTGQPGLAGRRRCAVRRRRIRRPPHRRRGGAGRRRRRQRGVCAGPARLLGRLGSHRHLVVRRLRPRRRGQRRADRHGLERRRRGQDAAARTDEADGDAPEGESRSRRASRSPCTGSSRRQPTSIAWSSCSTSSALPSGPPTARPSTTASAPPPRSSCSPGQVGYFAIYAYDHSGNYSRSPLRKKVSLASLISLRPLSGSPVSVSTPVLTWKATKGSTYYNVQVFHNGKHVVVGWPSKASYRIPPGMLKSGTYVWYVWPAVQHANSSPTFGKLIGRATFTYTKK